MIYRRKTKKKNYDFLTCLNFFWVICDILKYNFYVQIFFLNYLLPWLHEKLYGDKKIKLVTARKIIDIMIKVHEYD